MIGLGRLLVFACLAVFLLQTPVDAKKKKKKKSKDDTTSISYGGAEKDGFVSGKPKHDHPHTHHQMAGASPTPREHPAQGLDFGLPATAPQEPRRYGAGRRGGLTGGSVWGAGESDAEFLKRLTGTDTPQAQRIGECATA